MASNADLTNSVDSGSYKNESDERLCELLDASVNIHGANPIAIHRIAYAAEILQRELTERAAARREKIEEDRHRKIESRLDELKKSHWTVRPNFVFTVIGAVAAIVAAYLAWRPVAPAAPLPQTTAVGSPASSSLTPPPSPAAQLPLSAAPPASTLRPSAPDAASTPATQTPP